MSTWGRQLVNCDDDMIAQGTILQRFTPAERARLRRIRAREARLKAALRARPACGAQWLLGMFPRYFTLPDGRVEFAPFHDEFWRWVFSIPLLGRPKAFLGVWPRDTGKSTHLEAAVSYLTLEDIRHYALYVCDTQERADDHVGNIGALMEGEAVACRYPRHAERLVGKYNQSKGWRISRLRTAGGLTVDAIGLDKATRGVRLEDQRPDLIVMDDIDALHESPRAAAKKIKTITHSILPAGQRERLAVCFMQNIPTDVGVMAQLVDKRAKFLTDRIVSGPHPAFADLAWADAPEREAGPILLTGGRSTWAGFELGGLQKIIDDIGLHAALREYQHKRDPGKGALWVQALIDQHRVQSVQVPPLKRIVIPIDPATSAKPTGSETGLGAVGKSGNGHYYVLRDDSDHYSPDEWGQKSLELFDLWKADRIVAEVNNGGDLVAANITHIRSSCPVQQVHASRGKYARAEPIVALYERGLVHHVGVLSMLEEQMTTPYDPFSTTELWDRMDMLVWGLWALSMEDDALPHFDKARHVR